MKNGVMLPSSDLLLSEIEVWSTSFGTFKPHRTDGPAITYDTGEIVWCIEGIDYTLDKFCKELELTEEDKTALILKYGYDKL